MLQPVLRLLLITADGDDNAAAPPADAEVLREALGFLELILLFGFLAWLFICFRVYAYWILLPSSFFFSNLVCICFSYYLFSSVLLLL